MASTRRLRADEWSDWSDWRWDLVAAQYFRTRENRNGRVEYEDESHNVFYEDRSNPHFRIAIPASNSSVPTSPRSSTPLPAIVDFAPNVAVDSYGHSSINFGTQFNGSVTFDGTRPTNEGYLSNTLSHNPHLNLQREPIYRTQSEPTYQTELERTIPIFVCDDRGKETRCIALVDTGADKSFISDRIRLSGAVYEPDNPYAKAAGGNLVHITGAKILSSRRAPDGVTSHEDTFNIIADPNIDIIFGWELIRKYDLLSINPSILNPLSTHSNETEEEKQRALQEDNRQRYGERYSEARKYRSDRRKSEKKPDKRKEKYQERFWAGERS